MPEPPISARGKNVIIIGGGDTGADCLGTAHRQGAASVTQLEILPRPTENRPDNQPWPTYPMTYRVSSAHEEGGERVYAVSTQEFAGDEAGRVRGLRLVEVEMADGKFARSRGPSGNCPAELVLLAMGFTGADRAGPADRPRRRVRRARATWPGTARTPPRCPGCSRPGTWVAASR